MKELFIEAKNHCPLVVEKSEWSDPSLHLSGANWSLNTTSSWRLVDDSKMLIGSEDKDANIFVTKLAGLKIKEMVGERSVPSIDPVVVLSNGWRLEIFSAHATDPWVIRLPDSTVFVGAPTMGKGHRKDGTQ